MMRWDMRRLGALRAPFVTGADDLHDFGGVKVVMLADIETLPSGNGERSGCSAIG